MSTTDNAADAAKTEDKVEDKKDAADKKQSGMIYVNFGLYKMVLYKSGSMGWRKEMFNFHPLVGE